VRLLLFRKFHTIKDIAVLTLVNIFLQIYIFKYFFHL
jgi:hypothetical protein